jgi:hypothetical protein
MGCAIEKFLRAAPRLDGRGYDTPAAEVAAPIKARALRAKAAMDAERDHA